MYGLTCLQVYLLLGLSFVCGSGDLNGIMKQRRNCVQYDIFFNENNSIINLLGSNLLVSNFFIYYLA